MPPPRSEWQLGAVAKTMNAEGRARVAFDILERGQDRGRFVMELDAEGRLLIEVEADQDLFDRITDFQAWIKPRSV